MKATEKDITRAEFFVEGSEGLVSVSERSPKLPPRVAG